MKEFLPPTLSQVVSDALSHGLTGEQTDMLVAGLGINVLKPDNPLPFLNITLKDLPEFEKFVTSKEVNVVMFGGITRYISIFPPVPGGFPLARVYTLNVPDLLLFAKIGVYFQKKGIKSVPMMAEKFEEKAEVKGYEEKIRKHRQEFEERNSEFSGLVNGRASSTIVQKGFIFSSKGCLVCGADAGLFTGTLSDLEDGIIFGLYLCFNHYGEAQKKGPLLNYLSTFFGGVPVFSVQKLPRKFVIDATINFLTTQLDCKIVNVSNRKTGKNKYEEDTITATRKSGFTIIIRISENDSYAYMINDKEGNEITRIDNKDHHNVNYGPDHMHLAPGVDNKKVISSFTYGLPFVDINIIKDILTKNSG